MVKGMNCLCGAQGAACHGLWVRTARDIVAEQSTAHHSTPHETTQHHTTPHHPTPQPSKAEQSTAQHSKAQHSTARHSTAQHSTAESALQSTAQHSSAQHSTPQHSTAQHNPAQHSTADHSSGVGGAVMMWVGRLNVVCNVVLLSLSEMPSREAAAVSHAADVRNEEPGGDANEVCYKSIRDGNCNSARKTVTVLTFSNGRPRLPEEPPLPACL